ADDLDVDPAQVETGVAADLVEVDAGEDRPGSFVAAALSGDADDALHRDLPGGWRRRPHRDLVELEGHPAPVDGHGSAAREGERRDDVEAGLAVEDLRADQHLAVGQIRAGDDRSAI